MIALSMKKEPLCQGPGVDDPNAYTIRKAGIFLVRRQACKLVGIDFSEPFKGKITVFDAVAGVPLKVLEIRQVHTAPSYLRVPAYCGECLIVVVSKKCHINVLSAIR